MRLSASSLLLLAVSSTQVQAGLVRKDHHHHLAHVKRGANETPAWTSKHDSSLLIAQPPEAEIAQVRHHNNDLARKAYQSLSKLARSPQSSETSSGTSSPILPRAARPQGPGSNAEKPGLHPDATGEHAIDHGRGFVRRRRSTSDEDTEKAIEHGRGWVKREEEQQQTESAIDHGRGWVKKDVIGDLVGMGSMDGQRPQSFAAAQPFDYATQKIRAVNLGGWLVLEPWITPSIFEATGDPSVIDEFTYGQKYGPEAAAARLKAHWDTWITEADFAAIAAAGLNHVRLGIGYWAVETSRGEPYPRGQYDYLFAAVDWAKSHGLRVLIDIHGAPGSQNGFDNSGQRGTANWPTDQSNIDRTKAVIERLVADFDKPEYHNVVTAIELLNEPAAFVSQDYLDKYKQFGYDGYGAIRYPGASKGDNAPSDLLVVLSDAFQPLATWKDYMPEPQWNKVALDTHYYSVFNEPDLRMTDDQRIQELCSNRSELVDSNENLWTFVGEWTPANTDCAKYLNGLGVGARYDGTYPGSNRIGSCEGKTGDAATFSDEYKTFLGKYWEAQVTVFEAASGWSMWTWKTENAHEWSYSKGLEFGWIPQDPTTRKYPDPCK